jgi:hypothetical protein
MQVFYLNKQKLPLKNVKVIEGSLDIFSTLRNSDFQPVIYVHLVLQGSLKDP